MLPAIYYPHECGRMRTSGEFGTSTDTLRNDAAPGWAPRPVNRPSQAAGIARVNLPGSQPRAAADHCWRSASAPWATAEDLGSVAGRRRWRRCEWRAPAARRGELRDGEGGARRFIGVGRRKVSIPRCPRFRAVGLQTSTSGGNHAIRCRGPPGRARGRSPGSAGHRAR